MPVYIYKRRRCAPPIQAHVATTEPIEKHGKTGARRSGAFALNRLRIAPRIPPRISRFSLRVSVRFRHLRYRFFAHLPHVFALVPAAEGVREDKLSPVFPIGADDVVFHMKNKLCNRSMKAVREGKPSILSCAFVELEADMCTVKGEPKAVLDSKTTAKKGTALYHHAFYACRQR